MAKIFPFDGVVNGGILEDDARTCKVNGTYLVAAFCAFIFLLFGVIVYICLASSTMQTACPSLQNTEIHTLSVTKTKTKVALKVSFDVPSEIKAIPKLGMFVLSKTINKNFTFRAVADSNYNVSGHDQLLLLEFQIPPRLSVNLLSDFGSRSTYMKLEGDFKMNAKLIHYPLFPMAEHHATFVCHVHFNNARLDRVYHPKCNVR